jgi:hypothetical protein
MSIRAATICLALALPAMALAHAKPAAPAASPFDGADANHDGKISKAEIAALREASKPPAKK